MLEKNEVINKYMPLSDEKIWQMALADWYGILASLWISIGKPIDEDRLKIYGKELGDIPCELLERAIRHIHMNYHYLAVPTIGEIWQAVNAELLKDGFAETKDWIEAKWDDLIRKSQFQQT